MSPWRSVELLTLIFLVIPTDAVSQARAPATSAYERATRGTRWLESERGTSIKVLVEASNLGGPEVDIAEITYPVGSGADGGPGHLHESIEIFYILSGEFDHVVNGESHVLTPGMVGIVRPGDRVLHRVLSNEPVRAIVVWSPGGEAERIARFFRQRPVEQ